MNTSCFPCRWFSTIILLIVLLPKFDSVSLLGQTAFEPRVVQSEFIFNQLPHESCHASTISEVEGGLACAWFGGKREGDKSVGIWFSSWDTRNWSKPLEVANGIQLDGQRFPAWNPVLFDMPGGPLMLFYKVGPNPRQWWGMLVQSGDQGKTWSKPVHLPKSILGPIKNKPILLPNGRILCGVSTEHDGWKVHMETLNNVGGISDQASWLKSEDFINPVSTGAIQPTILVHGKSRFQVLCRNQSRDMILSSFSEDGVNWSPLEKIGLPNPNSGIDGVTLRDGRHVLVYNHTQRGRSPINLGISSDGKQWNRLLELENQRGSEFSYPAIIQTKDELLHITYTWKRKKIKHLVVDLKKK